MSQSLNVRANKSLAVLVIDSLVLRRAGVVSFLAPWADHSNIKILQTSPFDALAQSSAPPFKMILLVTGAHGVEDPEPHSWIVAARDKYADIPLVLVSEREEPEEVIAAFRAGVRGFIPMSVAPPVAMQAFTFIMSGGSFFPPTALMRRTRIESSVRLMTGKGTVLVAPRGLTARQQEVLGRLGQGESNKLIGRQLKLRESTVKLHIRQIMRKLGATNRTQAALCAARLQLSIKEVEKGGGGGSHLSIGKAVI
jgi:DNA-binding NarL/FixJ family response regulator